MKIPLLLLVAVAGAFGVCDLCGPAALAQAPSAAGARTAPHAAAVARDTVTLHVEGMTCAGCTIATRRVLARLAGVTRADVSYEQKRAVVIYDRTKVTVAQMIAAVATLRYTATVVAPGSRS